MSERDLITENPETPTSAPEIRIGNEMVEFLSVILQTPREYWPNLLKMMRLFLETVTVKPGLSEPAETPENVDFTKLSKEGSIERNQAMIRALLGGLKEGNEDDEMVEFLSVILQTPREYWPNLLKMMRLFLETVTVKPGLSEPAETPENVDFTKQSKEGSIKRNQDPLLAMLAGGIKLENEDKEKPEIIDSLQQHEALSKLLQSWIDDGDEQEQTETAEVLRKALEENPVHI
jgi:hypothetical protein